MKWEYSKKGFWIASRPMDEENPNGSDFIYIIEGNKKIGYKAEAHNNGYGAYRVAVKNKNCCKASIFHNLKELKKNIENKEQFWLYAGACNCIGKITKEEY